MKSVSSKNKIWIIITLVLLVVGMTLMGVFGVNNNVDAKEACEVKVSIDANINDAGSKMTDSAEAYFESVGAQDTSYTRQTLDDGCVAIYKFDYSKIGTKVDALALKQAVETAVADTGLIVEVAVREAVPMNQSQSLYVIIGAGVAIVAIMIYLLFMEKAAATFSVLFVTILSALLYVAMLGITRLFANQFVMTFGLVSAVLGGILATGVVNRAKEELKNEGNSKLSYRQIADKATYASTLRFVFIMAAILVVGALLIGLGTGYVRLYGVHLILSGVVASFVAYTFTAFMWTVLKNSRKDRKSKITNTPDIKQEQE